MSDLFHHLPKDRQMDELRFYVLFNTISVISGRWADDNERLYAFNSPFTIDKILPLAGLQLGIARSVG